MSEAPSVLTAKLPTLVFHIVGLSVGVAGAGIITSAVVDQLRGGSDDTWPLLVCGVVTGLIGAAMWHFTTVPKRIELLDVFVTVAASWGALSLVGAVPYLVTGTLTELDNALFESVAGFTTTGATVLRPIEGNSSGILFWRAVTQWMGGMGVIVLVVAVLPAVGSGGMDLLQAEAPGPTGERLTPRVRYTARRLWFLYLAFTLVLAVAYFVAGMGLYDAVAHSFTTVSTGGFSTYNASLAHFDSALIEWIAIAAMFLAGGSFTLWYRLLRGKTGPLLSSAEFRLYVAVVVVATSILLVVADNQSTGEEAVRDSVFTVLTVVSTTGYVTADWGSWGDAAQTMLLLMMPIGAMAGSTAGGVKLIRVLAVASFAHRETLRQLHPQMIRPVRIGKAILDDTVTRRVLGFLVLSLAAFGGGALVIAMTGVDMITAFSASATSIGNVGPGMGDVGPTSDFLALPRFARFVAMGSMLLGRLEIYPILLALVILPQPRRFKARYVSLRRRIELG